jgi:hypothetical protein
MPPSPSIRSDSWLLLVRLAWFWFPFGQIWIRRRSQVVAPPCLCSPTPSPPPPTSTFTTLQQPSSKQFKSTSVQHFLVLTRRTCLPLGFDTEPHLVSATMSFQHTLRSHAVDSNNVRRGLPIQLSSPNRPWQNISLPPASSSSSPPLYLTQSGRWTNL